VLCEAVAQISSACFPVCDRLLFIDYVSYPVELHIHGAGLTLLEGIVGYARGCGVVCFAVCGRLGMSKFFESCLLCDGFLVVYEVTVNFRFGGGCYDVTEFVEGDVGPF
jgi:hypothetical protein